MKEEPEIHVGLITDGTPQLEDAGAGKTRIRNLLIGEGFHWQQSIDAVVEGRIESLAKPQGNIRAVNVLGLERYLESVISSEMSQNAPEEFLKAHAVISRSWAMRKIDGAAGQSVNIPNGLVSWEESDSHIGFDVCSDDHCQRYQGIAGRNDKAAKAVAATRGEVLADSCGNIADARFSKCCGGRTELFSTCWADTDFNYLQAVSDPWCDLSDMDSGKRRQFLKTVLPATDIATADFHDWHAIVSREEIARRLKDIYGVTIGRVLHLSKKSTGASGRIKELEVIGSEGTVTVGKELKIRRLLSPRCLYSSWFDITETDSGFILDGHGWGHGVGLCQIGGARMAFEGHSYTEILEFYYHDAKIKKLYD